MPHRWWGISSLVDPNGHPLQMGRWVHWLLFLLIISCAFPLHPHTQVFISTLLSTQGAHCVMSHSLLTCVHRSCSELPSFNAQNDCCWAVIRGNGRAHQMCFRGSLPFTEWCPVLFFFFFFYWSITDLKCCISFRTINYTYACIHSFSLYRFFFPFFSHTFYFFLFSWFRQGSKLGPCSSILTGHRSLWSCSF